MKHSTLLTIAVAVLASTAQADPGAGRLLGNADRAQTAIQSGLGSGSSAEETAAKGFEGQQLLMGLGARDSGADAVDARYAGGFERFDAAKGVSAGGLKAETLVPTPVGYSCIGPNCGNGGGGGNWADKGRKWGERIGKWGGFGLGILASITAINFAFASVAGFAVFAAVTAGTFGRPGESALSRGASAALGFAGHWTGYGLGKAAGFVKGLFGRKG